MQQILLNDKKNNSKNRIGKWLAAVTKDLSTNQVISGITYWAYCHDVQGSDSMILKRRFRMISSIDVSTARTN